MKTALMNSAYRMLLLGSMVSLSTGLIGCQKEEGSASPSTTQEEGTESHSNRSLGTLQGALRLPQNEECLLFTAYQVGEEDPLFEIDIEQARVRNHQYSFLHTLPEGEYQVRGTLSCISEEGPVEYDSLHDEVIIEAGQETQVQFRFFFDVESNLNQVDLKFCADLMLQSLQPAFAVCAGEEMISEHAIDWHREDCGSVELVMELEGAEGVSDPFAFPQESVETRMIAPDQEGETEVVFLLQSELGDRIELAREAMEVIQCGVEGEEGNEGDEGDEDAAEDEDEGIDEGEEGFDEGEDFGACYRVTGDLIQGGHLDAVNFMMINGDRIAGFTIAEADLDGSLQNAINAIADQTSVRATVTAAGQLELQSPYPIAIGYEGEAGHMTGLDQIEVNRIPGECE